MAEVNPQFVDAKEEPVSILQEHEPSNMEVHNEALSKTGEAENRNEILNQEATLQFADANDEPVSTSEAHNEAPSNAEEPGNSSEARIKELESELSSMKVELETLNSKRSNLESQVESQATKAQQLRDENSKLSTRVLELEEASARSKSETAEAMSRSSDLQLELENQVSAMQQELQSLRAQNAESQNQLEIKTREVSENLIQTETLKQELARARIEYEKEKQELETKVRDMEMGSDTLTHQKNTLEQQIKSKDHEMTQLRDEKEELHARVFELEGIVTAKEKDFSNLQKKVDSAEKSETLQLRKLDMAKPEPESKLQTPRSLISENISKFNKILDQPKTPRSELGEKLHSSQSMVSMSLSKFSKNSNINSNKETEKLASRDLNNFKGGQAAQRKMDELADEFRKYVADKTRLLSQRIRVLEQLHAENSSSFKTMQDTLEQENKTLQAKVASYETQLKSLSELYETAKETMKGLESMESKLEAGNKELGRMANMSNELHLAKKWIVERNESIKKMGLDLDSLSLKLRSEEEKVGKLEAKVRSMEFEAGERDEELRYLGEEKREVIRQLCVLIDHLREENQQLKEIISKLKGARSQAKQK